MRDDECPICGTPGKVVGNVTKHFEADEPCLDFPNNKDDIADMAMIAFRELNDPNEPATTHEFEFFMHAFCLGVATVLNKMRLHPYREKE